MQPFRAGKPVQCPACRRQNAGICVQVLPALCGGYSGKMTKAAQKEYPGLPVVCAGGSDEQRYHPRMGAETSAAGLLCAGTVFQR